MECLIYPGPDFGTELSLLDDDFRLINFTDGFTFPFYGSIYSNVYINSNGNLTFNLGSSDYTPTFSEFIGGNPRIAPFWADLYPPGAPVNGGVFYKQLSDKFIVTWVQVPYCCPAGTPPYNTFQVVLYDTGQVGFAYNHVESLLYNVLVGVAKGNSGDSCIFRYNPPANDDDDETVDGPSGVLDGKQLFFDFDELECTLSVRSCPTRGISFTIL